MQNGLCYVVRSLYCSDRALGNHSYDSMNDVTYRRELRMSSGVMCGYPSVIRFGIVLILMYISDVRGLVAHFSISIMADTTTFCSGAARRFSVGCRRLIIFYKAGH